ncbi:MAG: hypothetical protein ACYTDT_12035 [Planctomycetota bacterium]|jgi:hypothetical protein
MYYEEKVTSGTVWLLLLATTASLIVGALLTTILGAPLIAQVLAWVMVPVVGLIVSAFRVLTFTATDEGLIASWSGIINKRVKFDEIEKCEAEDYNWKEFGGWGWRFNFKGDIAYSQVGVKRGLCVYLKSGKRVFVSLNKPEDAVESIQTLL